MEEWRNVPGWEWEYQVSNFGRFARVKNGKRHMRVATLFSTGYYYVTLRRNGASKLVPLHRIIAEAFIPKYSSGSVVNHMDGDTKNNAIDNLEWCTQRKNCVHRTRVLGHGSQPTAKKAVVCVETGEVFDSLRSAALSVIKKRCDENGKYVDGVSTHIRDCCLGKVGRATCMGYHWQFCSII